MSIIMLKNISLHYGERALFNGISGDFQPDQKIGIVGRNGAGKSTLLKVIAGLEPLDDGSVSKNGKKKIAYMPQDMVLASTKPIFDEAFSVFDQYLKLEKELAAIESKLENAPSNAEELLDTYTDIQEKLSHFDRVTVEKKTTDILTGLGFKQDDFSKPVNELSVGWKMRLVLAKLLLQDADFYLFDEPTNHLDMTAKEWFYEFLRDAQFGYLLVTHDRYFLEHACDIIFELSRGNGTMYYGNYSFYVTQKEEFNRVQQSAYERQQREIARKEATINRFRASASKAKMAQNMMKQLDRIERIEIEPPEPTISLSFPEIQRPGKTILSIENVAHRFGDKQLFKNGSCEITRGKKVALVAPNGTGKTTLFNLIAGKLPLQNGSIEFGHNVHHTLFEQDQTRALDLESTIFDEIQHHTTNVPDGVIRSFLGNFLFSGDDVDKKIKVLSGGEKNRVAMVKVLLQNANFLLLDEPTNHLDLFAKSVMLQALQTYPGTLLFVSHDHAFIQDLATDILELSANGLYHYPGTYDEFLDDKKKSSVQSDENTPRQKPSEKKTVQKTSLSGDLQRRLRKLENKIHRLEKELEALHLKMASLEYHSDEYQKIVAQTNDLDRKIKETMSEWEQLQT